MGKNSKHISAKNSGNKRGGLSRPIIVSTVLHFLFIILALSTPPGFLMNIKPPPVIVWMELPKGTEEDLLSLKETKELPKTTPQDEIEEEIKPLKPLPQEKETKAMPEPKKEEKKKVADKKVKTVKTVSRMDQALAKINKKIQKRESAQVTEVGEGFKDGTSSQPLKDKTYHGALLKYRASVRARIMRKWIVPQVPDSQKSPIKIIVFINKSGNVLSTRFSLRSKSEALNQSANRAISRASPFPVPPDPLKWEAYNEGFSVVFNPPTR